MIMKSEFKKIAIICASERELAPFLPLIENPTISERAMLRIHEGRLNGFEVAAVYCGGFNALLCGLRLKINRRKDGFRNYHRYCRRKVHFAAGDDRKHRKSISRRNE